MLYTECLAHMGAEQMRASITAVIGKNCWGNEQPIFYALIEFMSFLSLSVKGFARKSGNISDEIRPSRDSPTLCCLSWAWICESHSLLHVAARANHFSHYEQPDTLQCGDGK